MLRLSFRALGKPCLLSLLFSLAASSGFAQLETATISGQVVDPSGLSITGAQVKLVDIDRDTTTGTATNPSGLYTFPSVRPGRYRMEVTAAGFKIVNVTGLTVNVQDHLEQNFKLAVGSVSESMTVTADAYNVNTTDSTVSTVVDRQFAENLPLNGRSFQSLIQLTPGVVLTPSNSYDSGQFSVNGQRPASNYWMVDGVSANVGISAGLAPGNGLSGSLGSFSVLGGTNSLVSVDALQEFRIQTSTYAPEFGRTPGGQISIVTRSGTDQFHGTVFDYFRNDVLDANNWFNGFTNNPPLLKAKERQNDFGGTLGGPIFRDRTFFFFSYEGLRLRLPQTALTYVPDNSALDPLSRQFSQPALLPYINAFPLPNGPEVLDGSGNHQGIAQFNASYSNPATLNAYSLRIDHKLGEKWAIFARYNYSPSEIAQRGNGLSLSAVSTSRITVQTGTLGATWALSPTISNDLRFNYSRTNGSSVGNLDNFGGAVPIASLPFPNPFTSQNSQFTFVIIPLMNGSTLAFGQTQRNLQRQINIVDGLSIQRGSHALKFGFDFRRLSPAFDPHLYSQTAYFPDVPSAETGSLLFADTTSSAAATFLFRNLGVFAQDTWRIRPQLTVTYGLRWDVDFVLSSSPAVQAVTGFDLNNLSNLALQPLGTPPYKTKWGNIAPRLGVAYQLRNTQNSQTVLRGGFGAFFDLATSEAGNSLSNVNYPFAAEAVLDGSIFGGSATFPLTPAEAMPPAITPGTNQVLTFDPNLRLPYTLQWNLALEQSLGREQSVSASYIGATGRRLIQTASLSSLDQNFPLGVQLVTNAATSDYNALQLQFQRRLSRGLQVLASYTWAHSIDTASAGSAFGNPANAGVPGFDPNINRGPSDFDIRHAFSTGLTYDVPALKINTPANTVFRGWSIQNVIQGRSAAPVNVSDSDFVQGLNNTSSVIRPDVVSGIPLYLFGPQYPGGKAFNAAAFQLPPTTPPGCNPEVDNPCNPARQGNFERNGLRGFGMIQWDFAIHRDFPIRESLKLQFRAEMFNVLNHPSFGPPSGCLGLNCFGVPFGVSTQMLGQSLSAGNLGGGSFDPLYQIGGTRSIQFALKLTF